MDWNQVYPRIRQMVGRQLRSISGRADITLTSVDDENYTVDANAGTVTRKTSELRRIVEQMELNEPVHVDSDVLRGSTSSRNQPETILANLPDVEWTRIEGRKHIVWVGRDTHRLGTLRRQ
jgi:hypothetical protein